MKMTILASLAILNFLFFPFWIRFCFGSLQGLFASLYYSVKPDWLSFLDGSFQRDYEVSMQGTLFWAVSISFILIQAWVVSGLL